MLTDADLATPIDELERLKRWATNGYDVVIASRNLPASNILVKQPLYRQLMGKTFPLFVRMLLLPDIRDSQCGFKLFKAICAKDIIRYQNIDSFAFDVELLFIARRAGNSIKEVPVKWIDKKGSKINPIKDSLRMLIDVIKIWSGQFFGRYPLRT